MNLKKVFMSFALCLAILSGFSISASARTIDNNTVKPTYVYDNGPISGQVATNGSNLNVRRGPGTEYATIGSLYEGDEAKIYAIFMTKNRYDSMVYISYKTTEGKTKYGYNYNRQLYEI